MGMYELPIYPVEMGSLQLQAARSHAAGVGIDWVPPHPLYPDSTDLFPGVYRIKIYKHDNLDFAHRILTIDMIPELFDKFCTAFQLAVMAADDDRRASEEEKEEVAQ